MAGMVNVAKGQKVSIGKDVKNVTIKLLWKADDSRADVDIDISAFVLYENGKVKSDDDIVFYNNPVHKNRALSLNKVGTISSAVIDTNLSNFPADVTKIAITVTIYDAMTRKQNFKQVSSVMNVVTAGGSEIITYDVDTKSFSVETAIVVCEIYRYKDEWKFAAVGAGFSGGLDAMCSFYGVATETKPTVNTKPATQKKLAKQTEKKPEKPIVSKTELINDTDAILTCFDSVVEIIKGTPQSDLSDTIQLLYTATVGHFGYEIGRDKALKQVLADRLLSKTEVVFNGNKFVSDTEYRKLVNSLFGILEICNLQEGVFKSSGSGLLYVVYRAIGQLFVKASLDVSSKDVEAYKNSLRRVENYVYEDSFDVIAEHCDIQKVKDLNEWFNRFIANEGEQKNEAVSLEDLLEELNSLTGLQTVKSDVNSLINMVHIQKVRKERGLKNTPMSLHLVFSGNPGTGKTTVARLLARIYKAMGLLKKGHLVEVDRSKLVAGYIGQTAIKVSEAVEEALGGVLFVDEAYALTLNKDGQDFGQEAVDTLLKQMEDRRDEFIVIVAGYTKEMQQFLLSNPGLQSRFNKYIHFDDFTPPELLEIFEGMCEKNGLALARSANQYVSTLFTDRYNNRKKNYANARDVRNFFEHALANQANRLAQLPSITDEQLSRVIYEDVSSVEM